ncbi:uncharacterized protein TM35_000084250 [Trypanosoma theileri]|uniref:Uncharacterized protein n=1 Tax=Trypanosoma theileri TaxID=67003 RepID=A0A1X0P121_9TRYP|nr:uncharacterized protein TM35_000084250 [Trypanosoma theileri]ORC90627.1 hypothetical protein TM35_000084250 [Trypanosoma theileri]
MILSRFVKPPNRLRKLLKRKRKENRQRSRDAAHICGINTRKLSLLLISGLGTVDWTYSESVGNHLFTAYNNNNIIATVFCTLSTEKMNPDDTHWNGVHHFFVWEYLISFHFYTCKQIIAVHLVLCLTLQLCGSGK